MKTEKKIHTYNLNDQLAFGKHRGKTIQQLIQYQSGYVLWALSKVEGFGLADDALEYAITINKAFETFLPSKKQCEKEYAIEKITDDGIEVLSHYPWQDKDKIRARFVEYAHKKAEDVIYVMEPKNINPIQLTLF